ncbi:MAG TPA: aminotransferase class V-fold PLP-dependent enzyme [Candidatus Binatia bacterium]|nr:aminotransferase class V-fold PLP-dependent enzyme [Candidatus Binatia bacterium]
MAGIRGLFIPGPTNVPERVRRAMDIAMEDQRAPDLPEFTLPLFQDVKRIFQSQEGQVFLFPSSGTGGWEAAITNTLSPGDKVLAARFGQFSHLWIDLCQRHGLEVEAVDVDWGEGVPVEVFAEKLKADRGHEIKAVLVCHNETATGVTSDVAGVRAALDAAKHPALLFVDGVSSIASIDFRMDDWGVDIAVCGSQKGFMLPAGLAILCVGPKALETAKTAKLNRCYFDFADMTRMNKDGFFPYTPPLHLIRGLRTSVDMLLEEGLDSVFTRHHRLAEGVRRAVAAWGLRLCAKEKRWHSDTVSAILIGDGFDSNVLTRHAYRRYGLSLGLGLARLNGKVFRIGHLGDLNELMVLSALGGVELALRDVGVPIKAGSGVGAAVDYFHQSGASLIAAAAE